MLIDIPKEIFGEVHSKIGIMSREAEHTLNNFSCSKNGYLMIKKRCSCGHFKKHEQVIMYKEAYKNQKIYVKGLKVLCKSLQKTKLALKEKMEHD